MTPGADLTRGGGYKWGTLQDDGRTSNKLAGQEAQAKVAPPDFPGNSGGIP
jgi:hypothetical protein